MRCKTTQAYATCGAEELRPRVTTKKERSFRVGERGARLINLLGACRSYALSRRRGVDGYWTNGG